MARQSSGSEREAGATGPSQESAEDGARRLKQQWGHRATTDACRFYVASHPGWRDPESWSQQAQLDVRMLTFGLDPEWLKDASVLEMGCGVGRLVPFLLPLVGSYTGFDVAAGMVAEARRCNGGQGPVRFFESDGQGVPRDARDRSYRMVFSWAVLIHCPRAVIMAMVDDAVTLLEPGGLLRVQLRADESDATGIVAPESVGIRVAGAEVAEVVPASDEVPEVVAGEGDDYMGHAFTYREAEQALARPAGKLSLYRFDPKHVYCDWVKD